MNVDAERSELIEILVRVAPDATIGVTCLVTAWYLVDTIWRRSEAPLGSTVFALPAFFAVIGVTHLVESLTSLLGGESWSSATKVLASLAVVAAAIAGAELLKSLASAPTVTELDSARRQVEELRAARERAIRARDESVERFQSAFDHAAIGMALVGTDGRWLEINSAVCRIVGYDPETLLGMTFQDITHPEDLDTDLEYLNQMLAGEIRSYQMEKRYVRRDGELIWVLLSVSAVYDDSGEVLYFISQIQDINERKSAEDEKAERQRALAGSNQELRRFAWVASHDLQEPIRAILTFSDMLRRDYAARLDGRGTNFVERIGLAACKMQGRIDNLLEVSQIDGGSTTREFFDLRAAVGKALDNLAESLSEEKAMVCVGELPAVSVDPAQMVLLFQSLIANSLRYRSDQAARVWVDASSVDDAWLISVRDNGVGIPPEYHEDVFSMFRKLDSDRSGAGVGLTICRKIVERHGGNIWVDAEVSEGTRLVFKLPR